MASCTNCGSNHLTKNINSITICKLCDVLNNPETYHIPALILAKSKLSQKEICKNTIDYYIKTRKFPKPFDLDSDCKIINYPVYKYLIVLKNTLHDTNLLKLVNFKIFFCKEIDLNFFTAKSLFFNSIDDDCDDKINYKEIKKIDLQQDFFEYIEKVFYNIQTKTIADINNTI